VRSRLTRIVIPVLGLLSVTAALALVGTAPLVLFPSSKEAGPRPAPPSASSQVGTVTASPPGHGPSSRGPTPSQPRQPLEAGSTPAGLDLLGFPTGPATPDAVGGGVSQPPTGPATEQPGEGDEDEGEQPGEDKGHKDKDKGKGKPEDKGHKGKGHKEHKDKEHKDKGHKGKAKGHSKDKAHGEAKGHGKWQGRADVAFAPRGAKPSHVRSPGAGKHARRSPRSHARPRR
jgi:hypothetical protein